MGRPREHTESTAAALLDAAEEMLAADGPAAISVRSVAEAAGTSTRAVYALFGSKAGLLDALSARLFERLVAAIDAVAPQGDPVADLVAASVEGFRRVSMAHPSLYRAVFLDAAWDRPAGPARQARGAEAFARLRALTARLPGLAGAGEEQVRRAALSVHALTEGLATVELRGGLGTERQARQVWHEAVASLAAGLSGAPARTAPARTPLVRTARAGRSAPGAASPAAGGPAVARAGG